jgi:hypothetical protein
MPPFAQTCPSLYGALHQPPIPSARFLTRLPAYVSMCAVQVPLGSILNVIRADGEHLLKTPCDVLVIRMCLLCSSLLFSALLCSAFVLLGLTCSAVVHVYMCLCRLQRLSQTQSVSFGQAFGARHSAASRLSHAQPQQHPSLAATLGSRHCGGTQTPVHHRLHRLCGFCVCHSTCSQPWHWGWWQRTAHRSAAHAHASVGAEPTVFG